MSRANGKVILDPAMPSSQRSRTVALAFFLSGWVACAAAFLLPLPAERWRKPNVLILTRHEYYRKMMPTKVNNLTFDSIHDLARWYEITATIH
ncbi:MAG: hypothetical protein ACR2II_13390 [Chthoniobacterales bacterium]